VAENIYRPLITKALKRRYLTASLFIALMIMTIGVVANGLVQSSFFPESESDQIDISVELPEGTPYSRALEVLALLQHAEETLQEEISAKDGDLIENWYTRSRDNNILALVKLVPPETRSLSAKETAERLRELIGEIPDAESIRVNYQNINDGPPIE